MTTSALWRPWASVGDPTEPRRIVRGRGNQVCTADGRWLVDGISGALNASCGHGHPRLIAAVHEQLGVLAHYDLMSATHPSAELLATRLAALLPGSLDHVVLVNSGSEATEAALQIAVQSWHNRGEPRNRVVSLAAGYHGTTALGQQLSGLPFLHTDWTSPLPIDRVDLPLDARALRTAQGSDALLAAVARTMADGPAPAVVIIEALLNVGGGIVLPSGFLRRLRELCDGYGTLLVLDEVFCGFGRTGRMFGFDHDGITPDLVTLSKGISGGYVPLAAVVTSAAVHDSFRHEPIVGGLRYGHTTGGHAVAAALACTVLDVIADEDLVANAAVRGRSLLEAWQPLVEHPEVVDVRGLGLVVTVETPDPATASAVTTAAERSGVLVRQQGSCVMAMPPLTVTAAETERIGDAVRAAVERLPVPVGHRA